MKTRKTKKRNIIRRTVAFLLCMTMVLGLGMQDVIEQVYAEEASAVSEQSADVPETQEAESTETTTPGEEPGTAEEPTGSEEAALTTLEEEPTDPEEDKEPVEPINPTETEGNTEVATPPTETTKPSTPEEPTTPVDGTENAETDESTDLTAPVNPDGSNGSESSGETTTTPGEGTGTDEQKPPVEEDTKEEPVSELTYAAEDGSFSVKAAAVSEDVDLSGIEIHASQAQKDSEEYAAAEELVAGALDAESRQIEELQAYDIWFTHTENGETADLSGQVQISLEYTAPEFPEGTDAQLEVFCLNGGVAEAVDGTDTLAAGCELYALAWAVPAESTDTWEWTDEQVIIKASADKGVLPEGAEISVTPIVKTEEEELANLSEEERVEAEAINEQYAQTEEKLTEDLEVQAAEEAEAAGISMASADENASEINGEKNLEGFLAFDICFTVDGEEIEPNGEVNVSIEFKEAIIPEGVTEEAKIAVKHLKEDDSIQGGIVVEDLTAEPTTIVETENANSSAVTKVEMIADNFSFYTIVWYSDYYRYDTIEIHYVDTEGNSLDDLVDNGDGNDQIFGSGSNNRIDLENSEYKAEIEDYTYQYATIAYNNMQAPSEQQIRRLQLTRKGNSHSSYYVIQYSTQSSGDVFYDVDDEQEVYMIYESTSSGGGATGELAHRKYIEKNDDGTYDLTLNVVGAKGTETNRAKVDIVFVLDLSSSMNESNMSKAKDAVTTLTSTLKDKAATVDSKWKLVTFDTNARTVTPDWQTADQINSKVQEQRRNSSGGTNYERGLTEAGNAIETARKDAEKIVIFLTDGQPTMCDDYKSWSWENTCGSDHTESCDYEGALDGAANINCDRFYAVGMGLPTNTIYTDWSNGYRVEKNGEDILNDVAGEVQSTATPYVINVDQNGDLSGVFEGIAGSIISYTASDVTIVDTLTPEVDQVDGSNLIVKVTNEKGEDVTAVECGEGEITPGYNPETKELRLDFKDTYELKDNYTYSVTIKIEPNEEAEALYVQHNYSYPHTGEADTGETSAGKPGIFTNVKDSAKVTWTTNNEPKEGAYNRPVVQLADEPTPPPTTTQELSKEKYVKDNEDGTYDLTLNVSGQVGSLTEKAKVDIVLLVDVSTSMSYDYDWQTTRIKKTKEAVKTLTDTLAGKSDTVDSRWKVLTFGKTGNALTEDWVSSDAAYNAVNGIRIVRGVGTNYEAGFAETQTALTGARSDAEKIVIFLTDGAPTYAGVNGEIGWGSSTTQEILDSTNTAAGKISCNQFYAVGIGLGTVHVSNDGRGYDTTGREILDDIAAKVSATTRQVYNTADEGTDLTDIFEGIAGSITSFLCSNVTITDTLSQWAEVADENAELEIEVTRKDATTGEETVIARSQGGTVLSGATVTLNPTTINTSRATLTANYDNTSKTITLDFPDEYQLEGDLTYYVTVKIAPTIEAYEEYQSNGEYLHKGDEGTDAPDNDTSSNQPGFYSNDTATVTYTYSGVEDTEDYPKPVIQVDDMTTEDTDFITVVKTFSGLTKEQVEAIKAKDTDGDDTNDFTITVTNRENSTKTKTLKLSDDAATVSADGFTYTWKLDGYPAGTYKVEESNADVQNYELTTTGVGESITVKEAGWSFAPNVNKVTISEDVVFTVSDNSVIMIALKNPGDYLVWTKEALSLSQQKAVEEHINGRGDEFKTEQVSEIHFYSGEGTLSDGIKYGGSQMVYTGDRLNFSPSRQWKHVLAGTYTMTGENDKQGDIQITNTYELDVIPVDFQKFGTDYTTEQLTAEFKLEKMITETDASGVIKIIGPESGSERTEEVSSVPNEFGGLTAGVYRLTETEAPEGYSLLDVQIYFKVDSTGVKLLTVAGDGTIEVVDNTQEMFQLVVNETSGTADAEYTIQIKNKTLYALPQSGGPGIYLYMLGGVALMMAGTLLVYKKRKEEVLRS